MPATQSPNIAHTIQNLFSTSIDAPQTIVELDSAIMIQPLIASGIIPHPRVGGYQANYWVSKATGTNNSYDDSWRTASDIESRYSQAWLSFNSSFEYYDLFWINGMWMRQYNLYKVFDLNGQFQNYATSKHTFGCLAGSFRNYFALYNDLQHYFYHNRADLYYVWSLNPTGMTIDHRLAVTVQNSTGMENSNRSESSVSLPF